MNKKTIFTFFILLFLSRIVFAESPSDRYYIEGIVSDKEHPGQSLAVINGVTYRKGDSVDDFILVDVFSNGAKLKHKKTSEEKVLLIGKDTPPTWLMEDQYLYQNPTDDAKESSGTSPMGLMNPFGAIQRAKEVSALARIQQLKIALESFKAETDYYPENLDVLKEKGLIEENMYKGWEDYQFFYHMKASGARYSLFIEPVKSAKNKRYFYTDETGVVRAERGIQAGEKSPIAE